MGLWNFFGGNKIGPGHPRYERELRKHKEMEAFNLRSACTTIMRCGMPNAITWVHPEEELISVLKAYPKCPKFFNGGLKPQWGGDERHIDNWNQAQQWLREKENPELAIIRKQWEQKLAKIKDKSAKIFENIVLLGISKTLTIEKEEDVIVILKTYGNKPMKYDTGKIFFGTVKEHVDNWNEAQWWLKEKEASEAKNPQYIKSLEQKIQKLEQDIKKIEAIIETFQLTVEPER